MAVFNRFVNFASFLFLFCWTDAQDEGMDPWTIVRHSYDYEYFPWKEPAFQFTVKTNTDVHVALDSDANDSDLYEIVIGGYGNTLSMVRRGKQGPSISDGTVDKGDSPGQKGWTNTPGFVSSAEFRGFWIKTHVNNNRLVIKVGKEGESVPFMTGIDENPLQIKFVGLSSYSSYEAAYTFKIQTPQTFGTRGYSYNYFPWNLTSFHFRVKTNTDVHVALDSDANDSDLYEIVIGGYGNTLSMVRRGKQGPCISDGTVDKGDSPGQKGWTNTPGFVSSAEFRGFWIKTHVNNNRLVIKVGKEGESVHFMTGTDRNPLQVHYIGLSSWGSTEATYIFPKEV